MWTIAQMMQNMCIYTQKRFRVYGPWVLQEKNSGIHNYAW